MTKKVNFYTVDLHVSVNVNEERSHTEIKEHLIEIIKENGVDIPEVVNFKWHGKEF